jgi:hypothetical protein
MNDKYDEALRKINFAIATLLFPNTPILHIHEEVAWAVMRYKHIYEAIEELDDRKQNPCATQCDKPKVKNHILEEE